MQINKIQIIFNPISGRGKAPGLAKQLGGLLRDSGFQVQMRSSSRGTDTEFLKDVEWCDLLVVIGGDGTLCRMLSGLAESQKPVYMIPAGNESLFAKYFRMQRGCDVLLESIRALRVEKHHFAVARGPGRADQSFFCMASIGLDSEVVKLIAETRSSTISHLSYVLPTLKALWKHTAPCLSLWNAKDGTQLVKAKKGFLIIANSSQYALNLRFAPSANSCDQLLWAYFYPYKNRWSTLGIFLAALCGSLSVWPGRKVFSAEQFFVAPGDERNYPVQTDGDFAGQLCDIDIEPKYSIGTAGKQINILVPPSIEHRN